jgi:hypothetical protein
LVSFPQITQYFWIFTSKLQIDSGTVAKHAAFCTTASRNESCLFRFREQVSWAKRTEEEHRTDRLCNSYFMGWLVDICVIVEILLTVVTNPPQSTD